MPRDQSPVVIVGAGIAGLCCAMHLHRRGIPVQVIESSDRIGGRVKTDAADGFLLDHGFLVLQTAYPEAKRFLNYRDLALRPFAPGACIRWGGDFHRIADPLRMPRYALETALSPIGTFGDKLRMMRLVSRVSSGAVTDLFDRPESSTIDFLRREGFSSRIIEQFFRPFFSGVYLDQDIRASNRVLMFLFRMFAGADVALPSAGMGAIPAQLASHIPEESIRTNARVASVGEGVVNLESGETLPCAAVVLATHGPETARLLAHKDPSPSCSVTCLYFAAECPPTEEKFLVLNAEPEGPINSMCVISNVAPSYAPPSQALVSVTVLKDGPQEKQQLIANVRDQLTDWYGSDVSSWRHLKTFHIEHALPLQVPPAPNPTRVDPCVGRGMYVCGEYASVPGVQWAMVSGRLAAESVARDRALTP